MERTRRAAEVEKVNYAALLLAAGSGSRFGSKENKVLVPLLPSGKPVFDYSLEHFMKDENCSRIFLLNRRQDQPVFEKYIRKNYPDLSKKVHFVQGGASRQQSVELGLKALGDKTNYVLIHDAARPLITQEQIKEVMEAAKKHQAATLAVPSYDTLNKVKDGKALSALNREEIWKIQTPQAFETANLKAAVEKGHKDQLSVNEEGQLIQHLGQTVQIVPGSEKNIKLTTEEDLTILRALLTSR